jgi:hypothetical protein
MGGADQGAGLCENELGRPALTDRQIARMQWRIGRFKRLGMTEARAETLADKLADRDHERDPRCMCVECVEFTAARTCSKASAGRLIDNPPKRVQPVPWHMEECRVVPDVLACCPYFTFAKPA